MRLLHRSIERSIDRSIDRSEWDARERTCARSVSLGESSVFARFISLRNTTVFTRFFIPRAARPLATATFFHFRQSARLLTVQCHRGIYCGSNVPLLPFLGALWTPRTLGVSLENPLEIAHCGKDGKKVGAQIRLGRCFFDVSEFRTLCPGQKNPALISRQSLITTKLRFFAYYFASERVSKKQ